MELSAERPHYTATSGSCRCVNETRRCMTAGEVERVDRGQPVFDLGGCTADDVDHRDLGAVCAEFSRTASKTTKTTAGV